MHYRPIPEAHDDRVHRLLTYAFRPEAGPDPDDEDHPRPDIYHRRGLYDVDPDTSDDDLAPDDLRVMCAYYDFTARIRGEFHRVGGVSAVASPPESRRQGYIGDLLGHLHREFREEGIAFSVLWPFEYEFYQRFGYAMTNQSTETRLPPEQLATVVPDPAGSFHRLAADDWAAVDDVHREWATETLSLDRTEGWWRTRTFRGWRQDPYAYGWEDESGELHGYVFYTVDEDGDDKRMTVHELAAVDEAARGQLLRFCRDHDSQVDAVQLHGHRDEPTLLEVLPDPRAAEVRIKPGPMVRIVDLEAAVDALSLDVTGVDGAETLTLAVADDQYAWNDGLFELSVDGDGVSCRRHDGGAKEEVDVTVGIGALSQLVVGSRPVADLERTGDVTIETDAARDSLDAVFPSERVFLREGF